MWFPGHLISNSPYFRLLLLDDAFSNIQRLRSTLLLIAVPVSVIFLSFFFPNKAFVRNEQESLKNKFSSKIEFLPFNYKYTILCLSRKTSQNDFY